MHDTVWTVKTVFCFTLFAKIIVSFMCTFFHFPFASSILNYVYNFLFQQFVASQAVICLLLLLHVRCADYLEARLTSYSLSEYEASHWAHLDGSSPAYISWPNGRPETTLPSTVDIAKAWQRPC